MHSVASFEFLLLAWKSKISSVSGHHIYMRLKEVTKRVLVLKALKPSHPNIDIRSAAPVMALHLRVLAYIYTRYQPQPSLFLRPKSTKVMDGQVSSWPQSLKFYSSARFYVRHPAMCHWDTAQLSQLCHTVLWGGEGGVVLQRQVLRGERVSVFQRHPASLKFFQMKCSRFLNSNISAKKPETILGGIRRLKI